MEPSPSFAPSPLENVKEAILRICSANDQHYYSGETRVTFQTMADALNTQFFYQNPVTGIPFDAQFVIQTMAAAPVYFQRNPPLTGRESGQDYLPMFSRHAMPDRYQDRRLRPNEPLREGGRWQPYEDDALQWLLNGNTQKRIYQNDNQVTKLRIIAEELERISAERQWPTSRTYTDDSVLRQICFRGWEAHLDQVWSHGVVVPPETMVPTQQAQYQTQYTPDQGYQQISQGGNYYQNPNQQPTYAPQPQGGQYLPNDGYDPTAYLNSRPR